jgi:UDP-2-acetamido-3-amino-2,3-dideoxy-glucuronate N-acetyltransferase
VSVHITEHQDAGTPAATARIGVAGCGAWGRNLVRNFAALGVLRAIVDPDESAAAALAQQSGCETATWQALLDDASIDGVAIAAPAVLHARLAREALEAGKHVFVEKPLALHVADAETLCQLAERNDRRLMVGHLLQYHPAFLRLKELVRDGALGRLQYVYSNRLNLGKIRREEDILWSFAPHDISMILSLVGDDPERVEATGARYLHRTIADVTTTHLTFPGGEHAHIFVSWLHPFKEQKLVVVGDGGMAVFDDSEDWNRKLLLYPHRVEWRQTLPVPQKAEAEPVLLDRGEPLRLECQHFLDCIRTGATPRTDGREGLRVLRVLARATAALLTPAAAAAAPAAVAAPVAAAPRAVVTPAARFSGVQIHESAYVDDPVEIGEGTRVWHFSHVLPRTRIGRSCVIGQNVVIGPDVEVGDRCKIQNNVSLYKGVTLEDGVFCGPSCVFTNVNNPRAEIERKDEFLPTLVKRGVTIGANATIVCGSTIGEYAFIAAGAVVTKDVSPFALMAGVPARRIGWVSRAGRRLGVDLKCPDTGRRYVESGPDRLVEMEEQVVAL